MKTIKTLTAIVTVSICSLNISAQNLPAYVSANGLLGWWEFDGNANDESGNGNNGVVNGATLTTDRFSNPNSAYSFNGTSDYIEVADTPQLRLNSTDFTFSFWVKVDTYTTPATAFIVKRASGNYNGWMLDANGNYDNRLELKTSQGADPSIFNDSAFTAGQWHHVAVVYSQTTTIDFYVNGILTYSQSSGGLTFNANCNSVMRFGHDTNTPPGSYFLNGDMDDIGIWNRVLTPQEISNLFLGTATSAMQVIAINDKIYPNPFYNQLTFALSDNEATTISLYNFLGQQVLQQTFTNPATINTGQLTDGIYFYELRSNKATLKTGKVVKQ